MKIATVAIQMIVRLLALVLIVLGFLFWSHHNYELVPLHMMLGIVLVVLLWLLAGIAAVNGVKPGLVVVAVLWGVFVWYFGRVMGGLMPGRAHEFIRVVHFFIGLGAIGLAEVLGKRIRRHFTTV